MIRLRILGTLELAAHREREANGLLGQPKRAALLVYLALQSGRGPVSRDRLVYLLWPELSQSRGRRALSQALYLLRRTLGDGVIVGIGQESLRIDGDALSCDALEFVEAIHRGDPETALSLYGGDLLDGFHLGGTPDFEQWVDGERTRLRRLAIEAARGLSERDETAGDLAASVRWMRRSVRLDPSDEEGLLSLFDLLRKAGDASGIRHELELYRRWLRRELGLEPSTRILAASEAAAAAAESIALDARRSEEETDPIGTLQVPGDASPTAGRAAGRRNRVRNGVVIAGGVIAASLLLVQTSRQAIDSTAESSLPRVLVAPFANDTGDPTLDPLARLASDWLSTEVARSGRLRVVPPVSALRLIADAVPGDDTTAIGRIVAAGSDGGADLVLGGHLSGRADSAVFEVFGLDPRTGTLLFTLDPVEAGEADIEASLERLRRATTGAVAGHLDRRLQNWAGPASSPPSFESYQEYSHALDVFLEGGRDSQARAAELFLDAWRADTTFTAPLLWAIFALWNSGQAVRADSLAHALEPHAASMPEWDREMLRYHLAFMHGDLSEQYRSAAAVVDLAPDSEWRYILALAARHVGCRDEALSVLQDLGSRTGWMSRWSPAYWTVRLDVRHLLGDPVGEASDADMALEQLSDELHPGDEYRGLGAHIRAAALSGSRERLEEHLGHVRALGGGAHRLYLKLLYWGPLDLPSDRPEHGVILDSARAWYADRPARDREKSWYEFAQWVLAYREGDWASAEEHADRLVAMGWPVAAEYRYGPLAVLSARAGRFDRATALLDSIPPVAHGRANADYDPELFRARVAAIRGDPAGAVQHLRAANRKGIPYEEVYGMARLDFEPIWDYPPLRRLVAGHSCEGI